MAALNEAEADVLKEQRAAAQPRDEALSLGKVVAGLNAQSKGRRLGIFQPRPGAARHSILLAG